jgi:signal transduction histidine kinase
MSDLELDPETRDRYLSIVSDETTRLEHLVGDLLDLARLDSGGGALTIDDVSVAQLFERVGARHERSAQFGNVFVAMSVAPGAETVLGDQVRLEQALQNLAANAIRYAPPGTVVRLDARPVNGRAVAISVTDAGPGIAPAHIPHVFDRFYKVDPSRHEDSVGSGLGLSIVKAIVARHGATINLTSEPGKTVFEIVGLERSEARGSKLEAEG